MSKIAIKNKIPTCPCPCTNKFSHIQNPSHKIFHYQKSHTQQNFSISQSFMPTKFARTLKIYPFSYPQFCHKLHMPTNLPHSSWICSTKPTQQNFHDFNAPQNSSQSSSNKYHKLPTLPKFHKPPTLSKLHHDQNIKHFKNAPKPTLQHD